MTKQNKKRNEMAGALTAEAAVVLPVVILMILPFLYLFQMLIVQELIEEGMNGSIRQMATQSYVLQRASILPEGTVQEEEPDFDQEDKLGHLNQLIEQYTAWFDEETWGETVQETVVHWAGQQFLLHQLKQQLQEEKMEQWGIKGGWNGISLWESRFFYTQDGHHMLIKAVASIEWEAPFSFWYPKEGRLQRVYHCFMGEKENELNGGEGGSDNTEIEQEQTVYRIGVGKRYHRYQCYLIQKNTYAVLVSEAQNEKLTACERCQPASTGIVYRTQGGEHYHAVGCTYLHPNVVSMKKQEAIEQGYGACGLCYGEMQYFPS